MKPVSNNNNSISPEVQAPKNFNDEIHSQNLTQPIGNDGQSSIAPHPDAVQNTQEAENTQEAQNTQEAEKSDEVKGLKEGEKASQSKGWNVFGNVKALGRSVVNGLANGWSKIVGGIKSLFSGIFGIFRSSKPKSE